jgi:TPR repeat protein
MKKPSNPPNPHPPDPFTRKNADRRTKLRPPAGDGAGFTPAQLNAKALKALHGEGRPRDLEEAARWFRRAAEQGLPEAMDHLGLLLLGPLLEPEEGRAWLERARAEGWAEAAFHLGRLLLAAGELAPALARLREAAAAGVDAAWLDLAVLYAEDPGADPGPAPGDGMERAAQRGCAEAWLVLARRAVRGEDLENALPAFRRAGDGGLREAFAEAGDILVARNRGGEAVEFYRSAVRKGSVRALLPLARLILEREDFREADMLLRSASREGSAEAMFLRGMLLFRLDGDPQEALNLLWHAAEGGWPEAMLRFGEFTLQNAGDQAARARGIHWLREAVVAEVPEAKWCLGRRLLQGDQVPRNPLEGRNLILLAARAGVPDAMYEMGVLVASRSIDDAEEWWRRAAAAGQGPARKRLRELQAERASRKPQGSAGGKPWPFRRRNST